MRLELTRRADYGIRAMIALARAGGERVPSARIAQAMAIPGPFLPQVMAILAHGGFVTSAEGRGGGYRLARPASGITLLAIIEAIEGDGRRRQCVLRQAPCGRGGFCDVHVVFTEAQEALLDRLAHATLADIAAGGDAPSATTDLNGP